MYDEMLGAFTLSNGSLGPKVRAVRVKVRAAPVKVRGCPGQSLGSPGLRVAGTKMSPLPFMRID